MNWPGQQVAGAPAWPGQPVNAPPPPDPRMTEARQANSGVGGYVDSIGRQLAQGATFGLMDEISAGIRTGGGLWGNYGDALAQERARDTTFREDNPIASTLSNVAGAVAGPARAVGTLRTAAQGAGKLARLGRSGLSRGAVAGATGGALAGAGEGEGIEGRIGGAVTGGALGGAVGGTIGAGVSVGSGLAGRLLDITGLRNADRAADRQILRAFGRDRIDPATIARPQQGPALPAPGPVTLADLGGRNTVNLAAAAANTPGAAMEAADRLVQTRRMARPERIAAAVDDGFGGGGGTRFADEAATLREQRSTAAAPLYERAFNRRVPNTVQDRIEPVVSSREGQEALNRAVTIMEREGRAEFLRSGNPRDLFNPEDMGLSRGENGRWELAGRVQNMRLVDAIKRGMDDMLEDYRDPVTLRLPNTEAVRALNGQRAAYVEYLRNHNQLQPYARALDAWAGPSQSLDAMDQGRRALNTDPEVVRGIVSRMEPANQDFLRLGTGRAITEQARDPRGAPAVARRMVEDREMQRRLGYIITDPAQRAQFVGAMQREANMAAVDQAISPRAGSPTRRLTAGADDMEIDPPGGLAAALLMGRPLEATRQGIGMLYRRSQGINSSTADSLAQRLLSDDPAQNAETVRRLLEQRRTDELTRLRNAGRAGQIQRGIGVGVSLEAND